LARAPGAAAFAKMEMRAARAEGSAAADPLKATAIDA
jgi:hypothetical protein